VWKKAKSLPLKIIQQTQSTLKATFPSGICVLSNTQGFWTQCHQKTKDSEKKEKENFKVK